MLFRSYIGEKGAFAPNKSQNQMARQFIESVQDNNELLFRLAYTGHFDQKIDLSGIEGVNTYKSILSASVLTSVLLSLILTPLDLIVFN